MIFLIRDALQKANHFYKFLVKHQNDLLTILDSTAINKILLGCIILEHLNVRFFKKKNLEFRGLMDFVAFLIKKKLFVIIKL
jgi:hypothetical protein